MQALTTDEALVADCAAIIDVPKAAPPDSFLLHAPLELLARAILLPRVPAGARDEARARLQWLADKYVAAGPGAAGPAPALNAGIDEVVASLAAAGHAPILTSLRPRVAAVGPTFGDALIATELARYPDWRLEWPARRGA